MGCDYNINGSVKIRDTKETQEILARLGNLVSDEMNLEISDAIEGIVGVSLGGFMLCSYGTAEDVQSILEELSPFAVEAAKFEEEVDGEDGCFWVGNEEQVEKASRKEAVDAAREAIRKLTPTEWEELCNEATDPQFWVGSNSPEDEETDDDEEE